ncbi:MAG: hypothetical protein R2745_17310 [Vicinamibacterales bacterium]
MPRKTVGDQPDPHSVRPAEQYGFALQLIQYDINRLWTIYGLFLLAETVLLGAVAQVFSNPELVFAGSAVGVLLIFPWWATFENTRKFYLLRLIQAKDYEPEVGEFLTEGHRLANGFEIVRIRKGATKESVRMSSVVAFMRPQRSGWFLMALFAAAFIGISALRVVQKAG